MQLHTQFVTLFPLAQILPLSWLFLNVRFFWQLPIVGHSTYTYGAPVPNAHPNPDPCFPSVIL